MIFHDDHIRLQFVLGGDVASDMIAWFSAGHFSHVDVVLPNTGWLLGARNNRIGSRPKGVWPRPPAYAHWTRVCRIIVPVTEDQETLFYGFLNRQVGKPYDSGAIWGFITGRNWRDPDSWMCSELVAAALEHACICPELMTPADKITPVTLATVVSAIGGVVEFDSQIKPEADGSS